MFLVPVNRNLSELSRGLDRLFDENFGGFFGNEKSELSTALRTPALDVSETETGYTVKVDLPGVPKDAVKINIEGRRVSIDAEQTKNEEKKDGERVIYRERSVSRFSRSFTLPDEIDQAESSAKIDHGVLTLSLAKRKAKSGGQLSVS
jgi:HSP20 family protein